MNCKFQLLISRFHLMKLKPTLMRMMNGDSLYISYMVIHYIYSFPFICHWLHLLLIIFEVIVLTAHLTRSIIDIRLFINSLFYLKWVLFLILMFLLPSEIHQLTFIWNRQFIIDLWTDDYKSIISKHKYSFRLIVMSVSYRVTLKGCTNFSITPVYSFSISLYLMIPYFYISIWLNISPNLLFYDSLAINDDNWFALNYFSTFYWSFFYELSLFRWTSLSDSLDPLFYDNLLNVFDLFEV